MTSEMTFACQKVMNKKNLRQEGSKTVGISYTQPDVVGTQLLKARDVIKAGKSSRSKQMIEHLKQEYWVSMKEESLVWQWRMDSY